VVVSASTEGPIRGARARGGPWYVTAAFIECRDEGGVPVSRPVSTAHAKEMGTMATACGVWAYSWRRIHDLPFPLPAGSAPGVEMCQGCLQRVIKGWR
jgi:hypothetical protein